MAFLKKQIPEGAPGGFQQETFEAFSEKKTSRVSLERSPGRFQQEIPE